MQNEHNKTLRRFGAERFVHTHFLPHSSAFLPFHFPI